MGVQLAYAGRLGRLVGGWKEMPKRRTRKFDGKVYTLKDFTSSRRLANNLASEFRADGYLARITSGGRPVFYDIWTRKS